MKFGSREICDVTFKATANGQKIGKKTFKKYQPAFFIDTAKTSTLEQATTTVYATGGKGNARLIAWEGEKTMTFTVEDALISPQGLAVLSGAGLIDADEKHVQHVHVAFDAATNAEGIAEVDYDSLAEELGVSIDTLYICADIPFFAMKLDGSGAGIDYFDNVTVANADEKKLVKVTKETPAKFTIKDNAEVPNVVANATVKIDFYVAMKSGVQEISIAPEDFGGYFYIEADTLYRREDNGQDMAASIILPKVKVQSAMTFSLASSGDPSTFTFTMDAFPGYTMFDRTKKVMCVMQIVGTDGLDEEEDTFHPTVKPEVHVETP